MPTWTAARQAAVNWNLSERLWQSQTETPPPAATPLSNVWLSRRRVRVFGAFGRHVLVQPRGLSSRRGYLGGAG
ncbi:hypothetical protein HPB50_028225 [Hyalomma asiaticum]|nr:hypothetical protein HPB50_028225 [Hyalomma asiaticum]